MRRFAPRAAICLAVLGATLSACGKSERQRLDDAIVKIQSGETVRTIEAATSSTSVSGEPAHERGSLPETPGDSSDDTLSDPQSSPFFEKMRTALAPLIDAEKELQSYKRSKDRYDDAELEKLSSLVERARLQASDAESAITQTIESEKSVLESPHPEALSQRLSAIRTVARLGSALGEPGAELLSPLFSIFGDHGGARDGLEALFPYGLAGILPPSGQERASLSRASDPFLQARAAWLNYLDDPAALAAKFPAYRRYRDQDNPGFKPFTKIVPDRRVPVAFIDSGVDFMKWEEFQPFLDIDSSHDYADGDSNPWLPAIGPVFSHGTATTATLLSMISRTDKDMLANRVLELRAWKTHSLRQILSRYATTDAGPTRDDSTWENRSGTPSAVLSETARASSSGDAPRIVVAPVGFPVFGQLFRFASSAGREPESFLRSAPWLWIMAAGNSGISPRLANPSPCFLDVPESFRPRDRLLCIGAARIGANGRPEITEYSNRGPEVDFYTLDSYTDVCPSGTSCAAPAAAAAAAVLAARYPGLSIEDMRNILKNAAQTEVQNGVSFRFFDPLTMMPKAFEQAEILIKTAH